MQIDQAFQLAVQHHQAGQLSQAENLYRQILAQQPTHVGATHHLGLISYQLGSNDIALKLVRQAIALDPDNAELHSNLAVVLNESQQVEEAIAAARQAIALRPHYPEAYMNLGNALRSNGQLDQAITAYRQTITLNPNYPQAYNNLGNALKKKGQPDQAVAAYRKAIALNPNFPESYSNMANALIDQAQLDEAIAAYRQAIVLRPSYSEAHSSLVYTMHFHPSCEARNIAQELYHWDQQHVEPLKKFIQPHSNDRNPDRRLRIGYVSPDFRWHVVGRCLLPLLAHHDKSQVEVIAYSNASFVDATTQRLRSFVDSWHNVERLSDAQTADLIRQDRIDILVDVTLHMAHNRLLVFARKPAPIQVTWLGYPSTTGMSTMDYRLSDPFMDPPGMNDLFCIEKTIRLADTFQLYDLEPEEVPVNRLPALERGFVTFGCLNNFCKINQPQLLLWVDILRQLKNSKLVLLTWPGSHRQQVQKFLEAHGIDPQRLIFPDKPPAHSEYLQLYHGIDLGLDPYPYNGHTTSMDSLWMGVPVVSRYGPMAVSRAGLSQCSNLDLRELATDLSDDYVRIATELASDLPKLADLRRNLRQTMQQSPLMDAPRFARNFESAYRQMWQTWIKSQSNS